MSYNSRYETEKMKRRVAASLALLALIAGLCMMYYGACAMCRQCVCSGSPEEDGKQDAGVNAPGAGEVQVPAQDEPAIAPAPAPEPEPEPEPVDPIEEKALELLGGMTTEQKAGSLILVRGDKIPFAEFEKMISDIHAGGAVLFRPDFDGKDKAAVISMTETLQRAGGGHMLLCVDEEGGDVVRISFNTMLRESRYRSPQWLYKHGGMDAIRDDTAEKCAFLKGLGINVNFAPVADVVTDSGGFLYKRAFGRDAAQTAEYVGTVVETMRANDIGCTIKHFPGYGNAHGDTHEGLVESAVTKDSLYSSDLVPFRRGIEAGADSVMVTHTIVSCIDPERPCSLSPAAVALLREELGFDGVVITDGLDMGAIQKYCGGSDPCVAAFIAGCDLMCTPDDPYDSYSKLLAAINDGTISPERLDASVLRILKWKIRLGLYG